MEYIQKKIRVMVAESSACMRKDIVEMLNSSEGIEVISVASDYKSTIKKFYDSKPDIVIFDIVIEGSADENCLDELLKVSKVPVIVTGLHETDAESVIEALQKGAADFIEKPKGILNVKDTIQVEFVEKIRCLYESSQNKGVVVPGYERTKKKNTRSKVLKNIVAIGTSTGGPKALVQVISKLPKDLDAAILIVQHIPTGFTKSLAVRLNKNSGIYVKEAEEGDLLEHGVVYLAPGGYHMKFKKKNHDIFIEITEDPPIRKLRPSVDVMMESLSNTGLQDIIAVIMTGMGNDGEKGITKIKQMNNGIIIAQNKETCTIFGMPDAAVKTGLVDKILPIDEIPAEITKIIGGRA